MCVFCLRSNLVERNYWRYASVVDYNIYVCVCFVFGLRSNLGVMQVWKTILVCVLSSVEPRRAKLLALCKFDGL